MSDSQLIGQGWAFPVQFYGPGQGPVMVTGNEEIQQALRILMGTALGERAMRPDWGSPLPDFLFGELDTDTVSLLSEKIANTVLNNERRIDLHSVDVDDSQGPEGLLNIQLSYTIRETNTRENMVYPFYVRENSQ